MAVTLQELSCIRNGITASLNAPLINVIRPPSMVTKKISKRTGYGARQSLGYMLNRTADIVATSVSELLRQESVSLSEWRVLTVLTDHADQTLSELAAHAGTELSYLSRVVTNAEQRGLVVRFTSAEDKRSTKVAITDEGRALVQGFIPRMKTLEERWMHGIPPSDIETLRKTLQTVYTNVLSANPSGPRGRKFKVPLRVRDRAENGSS